MNTSKPKTPLKFIDDACRHHVELPVGTVAFRRVGPTDAPTVLFIHAALTDSRLWHKVADRLSDDFDCVAIDLPLGAHRTAVAADTDLSLPGLSRIVVDFIETLGLSDITLVGNDTGGGISQAVVTLHPDAPIANLVLLSCDAFDVFPPDPFKYLITAAKIPGVTWLSTQVMTRLPFLTRLPTAYGAILSPPRPEALIVDWLRPTANNAAIRRNINAFMAQANAEDMLAISRKLSNFHRPALILWADDPIFPRYLADRLHDTLPNSRLVIVENSRALVALEQPQVVADEIRKLVTRARREEASPRTA